MSAETWPLEGGDDALTAALAFVDDFHTHEGDDADSLMGLLGADPLLLGLELAGTLPDTKDVSSSNDSVVGTPIDTGKQSEGSSPSETAKKTAKRARRPDTRREELLYLRSTVQELETKLASLKDESLTEAVTNNAANGEPMKDVWEQMAQSQQQQRHDAELENKKLRIMLEDQLQLAQSLEGLLKKRNHITFSSLAPEGSGKRLRLRGGMSPLDDPNVEAVLEQTIVDMYNELETVLADPRIQMTSTAPRRVVELHSDDIKGTTIESLDSRLLPFEYKETAEKAWNIMINVFGPGHHISRQETKLTADSVFRSLEGYGDTPLHAGQFRSKLASRRFIFPERIVMLGCSLNESSEVSGSPMEGVCMRTRVWHIISRAPPHLTQGSGKPATLRQVVHIVSPEVVYTTGDGGETHRKVGLITNFVLNGADHHLDSGNKVLENSLLESMAKLAISDEQ
ncbi:hypothetical protein Poli38472_004865 [Pythium oligandrum]|uniref:Uncharacterized protein n=1 Tax=Pythium oligandrum TaxID=41045 RepID=A0A8K1CAM2_PYTOL|nr:hypothetical protein Poli38472_004865 [Pythium oligandrum]|eukprot:TMW59796.1 hypothetical protein Poli38472_004865 [Pythium oligandrum]